MTYSDDPTALLEFVRDRGRVCPVPTVWNDLWEKLPDHTRRGAGWDPPLPLVLAAWHFSSAMGKQFRLREHILYARDKGVLSEIDAFLRSLPEESWADLGEL